MQKIRVGIIIPAYNEGSVISSVLSNIPRDFKYAKKLLELQPIVVSDGSSDNTVAIARSDARTIVIEHILNSGAGAATRTGLHYLKENDYDIGATMDGDGQHATKDLIKLIKAAVDNEGDVIIGSRLVDSEDMPTIKVAGNKGLNLITRILLGVSSSDSQSGLKAFSRKTIDSLDYRENGYAFCSEMIWRAHKLGLTVVDVPIKAIYTDYSKAKGQSNWNAFSIIKQLVKHRISDFIHG